MDPILPSQAPTVKVTPEFKIGETVIDIATGAELQITEIARDGVFRIAGRAGLMPATAVEKKI